MAQKGKLSNGGKELIDKVSGVETDVNRIGDVSCIVYCIMQD